MRLDFELRLRFGSNLTFEFFKPMKKFACFGRRHNTHWMEKSVPFIGLDLRLCQEFSPASS